MTTVRVGSWQYISSKKRIDGLAGGTDLVKVVADVDLQPYKPRVDEPGTLCQDESSAMPHANGLGYEGLATPGQVVEKFCVRPPLSTLPLNPGLTTGGAGIFREVVYWPLTHQTLH